MLRITFLHFVAILHALVAASAQVCTTDQVKFHHSPGVTNDKFGQTVAISMPHVIFGAPDVAGTLHTGFAYIYTETTDFGVFTEAQILEPSDVQSGDFFGIAVAISGSIACVGGKRASVGSVYLFSETSPGVWTVLSKLVPTSDPGTISATYGERLAISGTNIVVGDPDQVTLKGGAYIFDSDSQIEVTKLTAFDGTFYNSFAGAVAIDGTNILVGADSNGAGGLTGSGAAYMYYEMTAGSWSSGSKLVHADPAASDRFGWAVDISGSTAVIGVIYDDNNGEVEGGAVVVFSESSPNIWVQVARLVPLDSAGLTYENGNFGNSVAISGSTILVGRQRDNDLELLNHGAVYEFRETTTGTWTEFKKHYATKSGLSASFGNAVALDGPVAAIGAYYDTVGSDRTGAAYVYYLDDVDDCPGHACEHGATCVDGLYSYCCDCPKSHNGTLCETCACHRGGICEDDPDTGIGYCDCSDVSYSGDTCTKFCNAGVGETYPDTGCNCTLSGATGKFCTEDVNDCESSPCANGGLCTDNGADLFPDHSHEFNCTCDSDSPFMGPTCEDTLCYSSPCLHGGSCINGEDFVCNCTETGGYEGEFCQTEIDECASNPCLNDGDCTDLLDGYTCDCIGTGYEGLTCAVDVDDCLSSPCQNNGSCQDKGANKFKCTCDEFWEGDYCTEDVDDCILKGYYCENGAACTDDPVNMGDLLCDCSTSTGGFTGKYCNVPIEDACVTYIPCRNGGKCILDGITKKMSCDCRDTGYAGDICDVQVYVSECVSSPCLNEGQCYDPSDEQDDWYCECVNGYFGDLCDVTVCDSDPCQNGGTCINSLGGGYTCSCLDNYSGAQCQVDEDKQVQQGSSSSSSGSDQQNNGEAEANDTKGGGGVSMLAIIIVIVVVLVGAVAGYFFFKKSQSSKEQFVMPT